MNDLVPAFAPVVATVRCEKHADAMATHTGRCIGCVRDEVAAERAAEVRAIATQTRVHELQECPPRFRSASLADCDQQHAAKAQAWLQQQRGTLVLIGKVGRGKTHLAAAIGHAAAARGVLSIFTSMADYAVIVRNSYADSDMPTAEVVSRYSRAGLLILDDVYQSTEKNAHDAVLIDELIARRYNNDVPTVITSNLGPKALFEAIGDRAYSRMKHDAVHIVVGGNDRRQGAADAV